MKDINIIIKDAFGREIKASTEQIEEDVLRMRMGLELNWIGGANICDES